MRIEEFINISEDEILKFKGFWEYNHNTNPEMFPLNMEEGDWFEQFMAYITSNGEY